MFETKSKGMALISVLLIISLFLIILSGFVRLNFADRTIAGLNLSEMKAFYLAEAGIEKAKNGIIKDPNWSTAGLSFPLGDGEIKVVKKPNELLITSIGKCRKAQVTIQINYTSPPFKQTLWKEL